MAFQHGKSTDFRVDNSSGSLTDISAYCDQVEHPFDIDNPETTTFGATSRRRQLVGLKDTTITASGKWDPTLDGILTGIYGHATSKTYQVGPAGSTGGNVKYTGEMRLASYSVSNPVDGPVTWSATFEIDNDVSVTTY